MGKAKDTKQSILEKAAKLFNNQGYALSSIKDLENKTGLSKGAIYGHFDNKEVLQINAFNFNLDFIRAKLFHELNHSESSYQMLNTFVVFYSDFFSYKIFPNSCPLVRALNEPDIPQGQIKKLAIGEIKRWNKLLIQIIEAGKDKAEIKPGIDSAYYSRLIINLIEGALLISKSLNDKNYLETSMDHLSYLIKNEICI